MNSITNKSRYILDTKVVSLFVVCIYLLVVVVSPFGVNAQGVEIHNGDLIREIETGNLYYIKTNINKKDWKRLITNERIIDLYSNLNRGNIKQASQSLLNQYTTNDLIVAPTIDNPTRPEHYQFYKIVPDGDKGTIKKLVMNAASAFASGYVPVFYVGPAEVIHNTYYTPGDPIYYTGTTNNESNIYRKTDALQEDERGTRIYDTIIPSGENRCTVVGDVVAVVGKPGVNYATITKDISGASLAKIQGGNVTIYLQANPSYNLTPSFTLECKQVNPLNIHTIDTTTLPGPEITFTHSGTGNQSFQMALSQGYHYCTIQDSNGNIFEPLNQNLSVKDIQQNTRFPINTTVAGNRTYNISIERHSTNRPPYQSVWTIQCHTPQTITLPPNTLTRITGIGHPTEFRFNWTQNTKLIACRGGDAVGDGASIRYLRTIFGSEEWLNDNRVQSNNDAFLHINLNIFTDHNSNWTALCQGQDKFLNVMIEESDTDYTPFITEPKVEPHPTNNNPNLLRNVITEADGINCANHLLGIEDIVADVLLVPENLCITYRSIGRSAGGNYDPSTAVIRIHTPGSIKNEDIATHFKNKVAYILIHELCHAQQDYYTGSMLTGTWRFITPKFADITGHQWEPTHRKNSFGWYYPDTGQYYGMYGAGYGVARFNESTDYDILETGAEFCMAFVANKAKRRDIAEGIHSKKGVPVSEMLDRVLNNKDAEEWIDDYMLNPDLEPIVAQNFTSDLQVSNIRIAEDDIILESTQRESYSLTQATFTVRWDLPITTLPTKLIEQGWRLKYNFDIEYQAFDTEYMGSNLLLGRDSFQVQEIIIYDGSRDSIQWFKDKSCEFCSDDWARNTFQKQKIVITPVLENSTETKKGQKITFDEVKASLEIDLYQLLIDRGLLNEDGSLSDE